MCISSNSVNQAQDLISVTKFEDFPNSLLPNDDTPRHMSVPRVIVSSGQGKCQSDPHPSQLQS